MLTKRKLEHVFKNAIENRHPFVGVKIKMQGFPECELVINPYDNLEDKLKYYQKAYDDNLVLHTYSGIQIVGVASGYLHNVVTKLEGNKNE